MELVHAGKISLMRMVELFTTGPARVLGRERRIAEGQPADLTLFSTDHAWTFRAADSASKSRNTPFDGRAFKGAPMVTIVAGRVVYHRTPDVDWQPSNYRRGIPRFARNENQSSIKRTWTTAEARPTAWRVRRRGAGRAAGLRGRRAVAGS